MYARGSVTLRLPRRSTDHHQSHFMYQCRHNSISPCSVLLISCTFAVVCRYAIACMLVGASLYACLIGALINIAHNSLYQCRHNSISPCSVLLISCTFAVVCRYAIACMLVGASLYAYLIGALINIAHNSLYQCRHNSISPCSVLLISCTFAVVCRYAIACMLVGASLYAYLVGALINIMQIMASAERERRDKLTRVNQLMSDVHLPRMQQVKVRHFMGDVHVLRDVQLPEHQQEMSLLSPPFAAALARHLFRAWLPHVWWLRTTDDSFITRMALLVKAQSFAPRDAIFRAGNSASAVYVLSSGVLLRYTLKGALHLEQCEDGYGESCFMFGQESLLAAASVYSYSAYAASYVSLWRIDRSPFMALLNEFPSMRARVRWGSAMLLLRRARAVTGHGPPQVSHEGAHEGAQLQQGGSQEQVEGPSSQLPCKEGVTQAPATANTGMESPDSSAHQGTSTSGSSSSSDSRRFDRAGSSIAQSGTRGSRGGSAGNEDRGIDSGGIANGGGGSNSGSGGNSDSGGTSGSSGNDGNGGNSGSDGGDGCGIDDNGGRGCGSCTSSASCVIAGLEVADGSSIISPRYSGRGTWRASHLQHMGCGDTSGGSSSGGTGTGAGTNAMSAELDTLAEGLQSALLSIAALRERVAAAETPTLV
eukprot:TRINITY_DN1467_c0_g2_i2.p1 TRINITY_DN1467_c0_g2~~TRINITY_DN1467_c0_g2_i2.p1  ORF type:complete len:650 (-),score=173.82 TRINITY_DN1467_c0_g2_i2:798-2747(-)